MSTGKLVTCDFWRLFIQCFETGSEASLEDNMVLDTNVESATRVVDVSVTDVEVSETVHTYNSTTRTFNNVPEKTETASSNGMPDTPRSK